MGTDNDTNAGRRRDWLGVGEEYTGPADRPAIEEAIERLTWCTVAADGQISGPMSPVMTLGSVIEQLGLPKVSAFALGGGLAYPDGPEWATFQLLRLGANYVNGRTRLYVLDIGIGAV